MFFNLWTGSRLLRVRRPRMQKANGNAFCPQFSLGLRKCVCCSQATRLASLLAAFFPNPMQEVCLWKDILVGKEATPRHRIAWRLTRKWVSCLSSGQLWAKPFPAHHQFRPFHFFFKYCQLPENLSEDSLFLHWVITYLYSLLYSFSFLRVTRVKWVCYSLICHGSVDKENYLRRIHTTKFLALSKKKLCFFCYQDSYFWHRLALSGIY